MQTTPQILAVTLALAACSRAPAAAPASRDPVPKSSAPSAQPEPAQPEPAQPAAPAPQPAWKTHRLPERGLSFQYPASYMLRTDPAGANATARISLIEDTAANRAALASTDGEGPLAMGFEFFDNRKPALALEPWIRKTHASNFHLSDEKLHQTRVDGVPARFYHWSGLDQGVSVAFENAGHVVVVSAAFKRPDEEIRKLFSQLLTTIELDAAPAGAEETCRDLGPGCAAPQLPVCNDGTWTCTDGLAE